MAALANHVRYVYATVTNCAESIGFPGRRDVQDERVAGRALLRCAGAGGQDGAHVGGLEPAKRDRPVQRRDQRRFAVGRAQSQQDFEFGGQSSVADRRGTNEEWLLIITEVAELLLHGGLRARSAVGCRRGSS